MIEFPKYGKHMSGVRLAASNAPFPIASLGARECKYRFRAVGDRFIWDDWQGFINQEGIYFALPLSSSPFTPPLHDPRLRNRKLGSH